MIKVKDGYGKLIGSSYNGDISLILLSNGGNIGYDIFSTTLTIVLRNSDGLIESSLTDKAPFKISSTILNTNLNAELLGGYYVNLLFEDLSNDSNQISITIGGTNKKITIDYSLHSSNLVGGNSGNIVYQSSANTTAFLESPEYDFVLRYDTENGKPYWGIDSDTKVTQTITTTDANYRVLFSATADDTTRTETTGKASNLLFNPSYGLLTAGGFIKEGYDDTYVLLAGGGLKSLSEFGGISGNYVLKTGDTMTGTLNFTAIDNNKTISFYNGEYIDLYGNIFLGPRSDSWGLIKNDGITRIIAALATGNVGIGTNTPGAKLHVIGNTFIDSGTTRPALSIKSSFSLDTTNNLLTIFFIDKDGVDVGHIDTLGPNNYNNSNGILGISMFNYRAYRNNSTGITTIGISNNNIPYVSCGGNSTPYYEILHGGNYSAAWNATFNLNTWSRILAINDYASVLVSIGFGGTNEASMHTYLVCTGYNSARIVLLGNNGFNSYYNALLRVTYTSATLYYLEILHTYNYSGSPDTCTCRFTKLSSWGTVTPITTITAGGGTVAGSLTSSYNKAVNFNADLLDGYHADDLFGSIKVHLHNTNDTEYPLIWSNQNNTNSVLSEVFKSYSDLVYNPANKRLTAGRLHAALIGISSTAGTGDGISLYGGTGLISSYGIAFVKTANWGTHGAVVGDWATYFTVSKNGTNQRGWIFRSDGSNVASIDVYGRLTVAANAYSGGYGINMANSDIININGLFTSDLAETGTEGLLFKRTNGNYDSIWATDGTLYFSPNGNNASRNGSYSTNYTVWHAGNASAFIRSDFSFTNGTTVADWTKATSATRSAGNWFSVSSWAWANSANINVGGNSLDRMRYSAVSIRNGNLTGTWAQQAILFIPTYSDSSVIYLAQMTTSATAGSVSTTVKYYGDVGYNDGRYVNITGDTMTGNLTAPAFYSSSDINLKINIQEIFNSDKMPIIKEFDWKEDGSHSYGLIAQELEELGYSELVSLKDDGYKTVNYSAALSLIVGKLQVKIKELEKEIETLKNKN